MKNDQKRENNIQNLEKLILGFFGFSSVEEKNPINAAGCNLLTHLWPQTSGPHKGRNLGMWNERMRLKKEDNVEKKRRTELRES